jgi:transcriptional regulator with XRE-family HTH domain
MIISPDQIFWFINNLKKLDEKVFLNIAKSKGIKISDGFRRSMNNAFSGKNKPSATTLKNIENLFQRIISSDDLPAFKNVLPTDVEFSSSLELLDHIEGGYNLFFKAAGLESSFIAVEVRYIFISIGRMYRQFDGTKGSLSLNQTDFPFTKLFDFDHDYFINMEHTGVFSSKFISLNIAIYFLFCYELTLYGSDQIQRESLVNGILDELKDDRLSENKKQSFWYYTNQLQKEYNLSFLDMSEKLGMDFSTFNYYRTGNRKIVDIKHLSTIWNNDGFIYFATVFTKYFVDIFPDIEDITFLSKAYETYSRSAIERHEKWSSSIGQEPLKS